MLLFPLLHGELGESCRDIVFAGDSGLADVFEIILKPANLQAWCAELLLHFPTVLTTSQHSMLQQ